MNGAACLWHLRSYIAVWAQSDPTRSFLVLLYRLSLLTRLAPNNHAALGQGALQAGQVRWPCPSVRTASPFHRCRRRENAPAVPSARRPGFPPGSESHVQALHGTVMQGRGIWLRWEAPALAAREDGSPRDCSSKDATIAECRGVGAGNSAARQPAGMPWGCHALSNRQLHWHSDKTMSFQELKGLKSS